MHRPAQGRVLAVLLLCLVLAFAAVWCSGPAPHQGRAQAAAAVPGDRLVRVATANVYRGLGRAAARADVRRMARRADVVLLQEFQGRRLGRFLPAGWAGFQGHGYGGESPVMWRRSELRPTVRAVVRLHRVFWFPSSPRYATLVVFQVRGTSRCLAVASAHFVPHIERPRGHLTGAARGSLVARALDVLVATRKALRASGCPTIFGGDWNVDYWAERDPRLPRHRFRDVGLRGTWSTFPGGRATFRGRHIDTLFHSPAARPVAQRVLALNSDHHGVRATFRLG